MTSSREHRSARRLALVATALALAWTTTAVADDLDVEPPSPSERAVMTGAFLPSILSANNQGRSGLASVTGGWDGARNGGVYDATAEAALIGPVSLLAGARYDGPGTNVSPHFELRVDALSQAKHGIDLAVAAGYSDVGFNTVPTAILKLAVGRNVGATYVLANAMFEPGLEDGERAGELRLAALYPVTHALQVGLDSRFQIDLERDDDEPVGETDWASRSGLVASYAWQRVVMMSSAGMSAFKLRAGGPTQMGPELTVGVGTVF